ncbi:Protein NAM8 [Triticum urartu]|uniref:RRM domain-containing protein n=2 Tax=Triticum TaxID=4564 RepID=A0A9R0XYX1_TRITD|nr:Protein NAM8 [Triticum urartu]VAI45330.1 unnamed protein product [Triticum turgidum subsp. durum]
MAVNEETSVYVGGLPYDADEDMLRSYFGPCGTIVSVKVFDLMPRRLEVEKLQVINDQRIRGKCYGFVTYTQHRAAQRAILEMDGKQIGNRAVRVNEVRTRGNTRDFGRDGFRRDPVRDGRDVYWDRRDRERSYDRHRDRDPYHDRDSDRPRDHDRDRYDERGGFDHEMDYSMDRDHEGDERRARDLYRGDHDRPVETRMDSDNDRDKENSKGYDSERDKEDKEQPPRKRFSRPKGRESRDISSSSDELRNDAKHQLDKAIQMHEDLENEVSQIRDKVTSKDHHIADLQKKSQKLEDELAAARKVSSERQLTVTKLYKSFLQLQDYNDRAKTAEEDLKALVDSAMAEVDMAEDATTKDGSGYENGMA